MKKISTILVAMVMMVVSFAGCGGGSGSDLAGIWKYDTEIQQVDSNEIAFTMEAAMTLVLNDDDTFSFVTEAGLTDEERERYATELFDYIVSQQSNDSLTEEELIAELEAKMGTTKAEFIATTAEELKAAQSSQELTGEYTVDGDTVTLTGDSSQDVLTLQDGKLKLEGSWEYSEEVLLERE